MRSSLCADHDMIVRRMGIILCKTAGVIVKRWIVALAKCPDLKAGPVLGLVSGAWKAPAPSASRRVKRFGSRVFWEHIPGFKLGHRAFRGTAERAAEKACGDLEIPKKHPSGAKAQQI